MTLQHASIPSPTRAARAGVLYVPAVRGHYDWVRQGSQSYLQLNQAKGLLETPPIRIALAPLSEERLEQLFHTLLQTEIALIPVLFDSPAADAPAGTLPPMSIHSGNDVLIRTAKDMAAIPTLSGLFLISFESSLVSLRRFDSGDALKILAPMCSGVDDFDELRFIIDINELDPVPLVDLLKSLIADWNGLIPVYPILSHRHRFWEVPASAAWAPQGALEELAAVCGFARGSAINVGRPAAKIATKNLATREVETASAFMAAPFPVHDLPDGWLD